MYQEDQIKECMGHVACMGEMTLAYEILVGNLKGDWK
jgi:hypothetical protein